MFTIIPIILRRQQKVAIYQVPSQRNIKKILLGTSTIEQKKQKKIEKLSKVKFIGFVTVTPFRISAGIWVTMSPNYLEARAKKSFHD